MQEDSEKKPSLSWSQPAAPQASTTKPLTPAPSAKAAPSASPIAQTGSNAGTYVGIFVAGLIVGALLGWGITSSHTGATPAVTASSTEMTASTTASATTPATASTGSILDTSGSSDIAVPSPQQSGFAVTVSKIAVTQATWLVVYEDQNGKPGNAIGAGLFFPGDTSGTIQLLRATTPGASYLVGQSVDNGSRTFSLTADKPVVDEEGNPLFTEFTAQ